MRFLSSVQKHRNLYCRHYDGCLGHAVKQRWEGWSCYQCPIFLDLGQLPDIGLIATSSRRDS